MGKTEKRELVLLASVDEATIQRSIKRLNELREDAIRAAQGQDVLGNAAKESARGLGQASQGVRDHINAVRQEMAVARLDVDARLRGVQALREETEAREKVAIAARQQAAATRQTQQQAAFEGAGRISTAGSSFAALLPGAGGQALMGIADLAGAIEQLPMLTQGIRGIGGAAGEAGPVVAGLGGSIGSLAAAGAAGVALAALAIAVQRFIKDITEMRERVKAATDAQVTYYELIQTGTREEIEAEIQRLEVQRRAREETKRSLEAALEAQGPINRLLANLGLGVKQNINDLNKELDSLTFQTDAYRRALESEEVAKRANTEASERAAEAAAKGREQARERRDDLIAAELTNSSEIRAARTQFNEDLKAMDDKLAEDRIRIAAQTSQQILAIEARRDEQIKQLDVDLLRADEAASRKLQDSILAVEQGARDRELALREESASRIQDLIERAEREKARIISESNDAERDARFNRDAVALDKAERDRETRLQEADDQLQEGIQQEQEALAQKLRDGRRADQQRIRDLQQSYQQERRDRQIAAQQRINDIRAAAQQEIALTRQRAAEALNALNDQYQRERQLRITKFAEELRTYGVHFDNINSLTASALNSIAIHWADLYRQMAAAMTGGSSGGGGGGGGFTPGGHTPLASGVREFKGGLALLGERGPEFAYLARGTNVYNAQDTRRMVQQIQGGPSMRDVNVSIVTQATDARGIMREVERKFPSMFADVLEKIAK